MRLKFLFKRQLGFAPRVAGSLLRIPLAAAGAGAGVAAYLHGQVKEVVPDWVFDSVDKATKWFKSLDVSFVDVDIDIDGIRKSLLDQLKESSKSTVIDESSQNTAIDESSKNDVVVENTSTLNRQQEQQDKNLMLLTKQLIQVRHLLKDLENSPSALVLPSIVVIGSQSSGKSSVLESIVGHEFLPKGSNMVTRRPIELTLVHTPDGEEYCEFPQLELGKIKDFTKVQKTLTDLNLAVSADECVSKKPIELHVFSPNVPDLSLVDLPGYIQIHNKDQPPILKEKIAELCDQYICEPNIILAVCSADVDLANSEALRASRRVDPLGLRTIGVVTKMDLVEPSHGLRILNNQDYPLSLGYVGVVNKFKTGDRAAMIRKEASYFESHKEYPPSMVGSETLRNRLVQVLESHMGSSLHTIVDQVEMELNDARYQFKVDYDDRRISPESYVAETMDVLKQRFKTFKSNFGKPQVREHLRRMLEDRLVQVCSSVYWKDSTIQRLPNEKNAYWDNKLEISSGSLTKSGVGKSTVQLVIDLLSENVNHLTAVEPWNYHQKASQQVLQFSNSILRSRFHTTVEQVENTIKPFKFEIECSSKEWSEAQTRASSILQRVIAGKETELRSIKSSIGRRRLRQAIKRYQRLERDNSLPDVNDENSVLLSKAKDALEVQNFLKVLQQRLSAVKSRQCSSFENKANCPEVYLAAVTEKLAYTAVMFINLELLNEFFFQLPREIDEKMYYGLSRTEILEFAKENPTIAGHLLVQDRKNRLEKALDKLKDLTRSDVSRMAQDDPFFIVKREVEQSLSEVSTLFKNWTQQGYPADEANKRDMRDMLRNIAADLDELDDTIKIVQSNPARFQLDAGQIEERRRFVSEARRTVDGMRTKLNNPQAANNRQQRDNNASNSKFIEREEQQQQMLMQNQDKQLQDVSVTVRNLGEIARVMGDELDDQARYFDVMFDY